MESKNVKQCIQFYYLWKKVCTDEYRKLRNLRWKREQVNFYYNGTSGKETTGDEKSSAIAEDSKSTYGEDEDGSITPATTNGFLDSDHEDITDQGSVTDSRNPSPAPSSIGSQEVYPCKVCGREFSKVKSRSAHMKTHGAGAAASVASFRC